MVPDGSFRAALAAEEALTLGEPPANVHHLRARIEEERGRFAPALEEYRLAVAIDRTMAPALSGEASVLYKLSRYEEARASAEAALKLDAANEEARRVLKQAKEEHGAQTQDVAQAVRFVQKTGIDSSLPIFQRLRNI